MFVLLLSTYSVSLHQESSINLYIEMRKITFSGYRPSFKSGVMSLFTFGIDSDRFKDYFLGNDSDYIADDWRMLGNDMRSAISQFERQIHLWGVLLIHKFECKPFRKSRSFGISRPS